MGNTVHELIVLPTGWKIHGDSKNWAGWKVYAHGTKPFICGRNILNECLEGFMPAYSTAMPGMIWSAKFLLGIHEHIRCRDLKCKIWKYCVDLFLSAEREPYFLQEQ